MWWEFFSPRPHLPFLSPALPNKCCLHIIWLEHIDENILFSTTTTESDNKGLKLAWCLTKQEVILQIGTCWLTEKTRETNIRHIDWGFDVANILHNCWCIFGRCISTRKAWPQIVLLTKDRRRQTFWDPCFSSASKLRRAIYIRAARRQWAVFITFYFAGQGATHFPQYRLYRVSQTDVVLLLDRPLLPSGVQSRQKLLQNMIV